LEFRIENHRDFGFIIAMSEVVAKRPVGRPKGSTMGIMERMKRYQVAERCAEITPEVIDFWTRVVRNENLPIVLRMQAADRLMDRAYGRPPVAMEIDATNQEMSLKKIVHVVRWLPPDPNDTSNVIQHQDD
jgi:hypothetical protein